jgi:hypothetical protein
MRKQTKIQLLESMMLNSEPIGGEISEDLLNQMINALRKDRDSELTFAPSSLFIYNNSSHKYIFIDENINKVVNFSADEVMEMTSVEFLNKIVVEEHVIPATYLATKMYTSFYSRESIENGSINFEINFHPGKKPNEIRRLLIVFRPTHWNHENRPLLNFGKMYDITHLSKMGPPRLMVIKKNKITYKEEAESEYISKENNFGLTAKELELISLVAEGLDNKDIAHKMKSSIATIYTHRKNIKGKTKKSMISLISELSARGLI